MKKILRSVSCLLGQKRQHQLLRRLFRPGPFASRPDLKLEMARSESDLQQAVSLLHVASAGLKKIDPETSARRSHLFAFLPNTTTIVAKLGDVVIGAASLTRDSSFGLPSDGLYAFQNDSFRDKGQTLVELSALSVSMDYQKHENDIFHLLMTSVTQFALQCFAGDRLIVTTHPQSEKDYVALFGFQKSGTVTRFGSIHGVPSVMLSLPLDSEKNLAAFLSQQDSRLHLPLQKMGQTIHPVLTPHLIKRICSQHPHLWQSLSPIEKSDVSRIYMTLFGVEALRTLPSDALAQPRDRDFRTPLRLETSLSLKEEVCFGEIRDLSSGGCFVEVAGDLPSVGTRSELTFQLDSKRMQVRVEVVWQKKSRSPLSRSGVGVRFLSPLPKLNSDLQRWLYNEKPQDRRENQMEH